ncbi:hypothetical protein M758_8G004800 [Ceratodon purpureus]|uniref:C3H1-type domain-containing protein n=1 Tax=Ceratodon purpureus TaxID=3225 RepID=A0A8T0GTS9_CERPU|nr:hypothetical protein KC19_8G005400 [Ceratodon purpureus]KAG0607137.1 hypothetical protein M758_8G004800 [Ceratodon purpureus]
MPAHKYYCDYCDKQFYDTPKSRKRHLQGIFHQRAKKQWFDSFRDQESGSTQDGNRPPCTFFLRTGTCQYGSECRFEHPAQNPGPLAPAPLAPVPLEAFNAPESAALANFLTKDLPPSLRPPAEGGYPLVDPVEWG